MGVRSLVRRMLVPEESQERALDTQLFFETLKWLGNTYTFDAVGPNQLGSQERIAGNYAGFVAEAYKGNPIVFGAIAWRMRVFSEARFAYQRMRESKPGDLFGTPALRILERPRPGWTTGDLIARIILDNDLAGNSYTVARPNGQLRRLRPDWVSIISGAAERDANPWDVDAEVLGYAYQPGGPFSGQEPVTFRADEVAHVALYPDPTSPTRGISWLQPILTDIDADTAAATHKLKFFQNGATIGQTVVLENIDDPDVLAKWVEKFNKAHRGVADAYSTLFLTAGAKPVPIGTNLQQQDFKATQGAGETRIALAAGIHPVVLGLSEGMQGSSLNAGNYVAARRSTADATLRPGWRNIAGSLETIVPVPSDARLWYDESGVAFLREDQKDAAEIQQMQAQTMKALFDSGWAPDQIVDAVVAGDWTRLKHTGVPSVQVQKVASPGGNGQMPAGVGAPAE